MKILLVKTSSLGDILQCFKAVYALKTSNPTFEIDWVVEKEGKDVVELLPFIRKTFIWNRKKTDNPKESFKNFFSMIQEIRKEEYDYILDLQGNCKSGLITFLSRGKKKVGFNFSTLPEKLNFLATNQKVHVDKNQNKRLFYLEFIQKLFFKNQKRSDFTENWTNFIVSAEKLPDLLENLPKENKKWVMVCPFSKMKNKEMDVDFIGSLIEKNAKAYFFILCATHEEKLRVQFLKNLYPNQVMLIDKLSIGQIYQFMNRMDAILGADSFCLHLASLTKVKTYAFFGPTSAKIFEPLKNNHFSYQGECPYGKLFTYKCSEIKKCTSKSCMKSFETDLHL